MFLFLSQKQYTVLQITCVRERYFLKNLVESSVCVNLIDKQLKGQGGYTRVIN